MSLLSIIPIACAIYVIYGVWIKEGSKRSTLNKVKWSVFALVFNVITALFYAARKPL